MLKSKKISNNSKKFGKRVLVADENPDSGRLLQERLTKQGFRCALTNSLEKLLEKIKSFKPQIVLLDAGMALSSEPGIIGKAKAIDPEVSCIMISDNQGKAEAVKAYKAGASDLLFKPVLPAEIKPALERSLDKSRLEQTCRSLQLILSDTYQMLGYEIQSPAVKTSGKYKIDRNLIKKIEKIHRQLVQNRDKRMNHYLETVGLTPRERQVALEVPHHYDLREMSAHLEISIHTLRTHLKKIYKKLRVNSRKLLITHLKNIP